MFAEIPYIPGTFLAKAQPLERFLSPVPKGVVSTWLESNLPIGSWILDPFGVSPNLMVEAAASGYKVLSAINNPVMRLLSEMAANPPNNNDLQAALAALASARKGNSRIEPEIRSLYETECENCTDSVMVQAFLWNRSAQAPYGRIYECPHCGDSGERPVNEADISRALRFGGGGMHHSRALERVASINDPDRAHAEEALAAYTPRAVYALITLINKLDGLGLHETQHRNLEALLLHTFDQANNLWPYPTGRTRPRQLVTPPKYRENNIWLALETAIRIWAANTHPIPLSIWPDQPPDEGGISIFEGRAKDLAKNINDINVKAVITAFPRPNQAFWTLSALWSGWLWGRETVEQFKSVLRRRRYDWSWHASALYTAISSFSEPIKQNTPLFGLIGETEPGFLTSVLLAGYLANYNIQGIAIRSETNQAQISMQKTVQESFFIDNSERMESIINSGARAYLDERGEPADYLNLHSAGLANLIDNNAIPSNQPPGEILSQVQASFKQALTYRHGFLRYGGSEKSLEVGKWWLREHDADILPLADRIEIAFVEYLLKHPGSTIAQLENSLCQSYQGLNTPALEFVQICLDSYGEQSPPHSGYWVLRPQDSPKSRRADLEDIGDQLVNLGEQLGFLVEKKQVDPPAYLWMSPDNQQSYMFYLTASAVLGKFTQINNNLRTNPIIVLPGGRSNLVAYKLQNNPHLKLIISEKLTFLKYRHLRSLLDNPSVNRENIEANFSLDPLTYAEPQLRML